MHNVEQAKEIKQVAGDLAKSFEKLNRLNERHRLRLAEGSTRARSTTYHAEASTEAETMVRLKGELKQLCRKFLGMETEE